MIKSRLGPVLVAWLVWLSSFGFLHTIAERLALSWHLVECVYGIFGRPSSPYSASDLFLPDCLSFAVISGPPTMLGLLTFQGRGKLSLRTILLVTTAVAALPALAMGDPATVLNRPLNALLFFWLMVIFTVVLGWMIVCPVSKPKEPNDPI